MNDRNQITFMQTKEHIVPFVLSGVYHLKPQNRLVWLQRAALWVLKKLKCEYVEQRTEYERVSFDARDVYEQLRAMYVEVSEQVSPSNNVLLIGRTEFHQLMDVDVFRYMRFKSPLAYSRKTTLYGEPVFHSEMFDLHVVVVPWMKGMMIVPGN